MESISFFWLVFFCLDAFPFSSSSHFHWKETQVFVVDHVFVELSHPFRLSIYPFGLSQQKKNGRMDDFVAFFNDPFPFSFAFLLSRVKIRAFFQLKL